MDSGFLNDCHSYGNQDENIAFEDAVLLKKSGSTCEVYRTHRHLREVFVKRLKQEFRSHPVYLDALDKEFEIGVGLRHPSLPYYREFHRDYIVIDYIDGETLSEMIQRGDPWLCHERNIVRLLRQLVDVVDYLHRHGICHCDIKPDNLMITSRNKNLVLIDFDKSYTDSLCDTPGDPERYGLPVGSEGSVRMDMEGIARLMEEIKGSVRGFRFRKYRDFTAACRTGADFSDLEEILDYDPLKSKGKIPILIILMTLLGVGWATYYIFSNREERISNLESIAATSDSMIVCGVEDSIVIPEDGGSSQSLFLHEERLVSQDELMQQAQTRAGALDPRIRSYYDDLHAGLDRLLLLQADTSLRAADLLEAIREHGDKEEGVLKETEAILKDMVPGITDRELWRVLGNSVVYTRYMRRARPLQRDYAMEYERRRAKE